MSDNQGKNAIERYLQGRGRKTIDSEQRERIDRWLCWYRGFVKDFHNYSVYTGKRRHSCERYKLGMGKQVCEDFATLLLNEKVQINATSFAELPNILEANNFLDRANRLLELTMALGTGALVEFLDADGKPVIDYIRGDMIYPLNWDGDNITECAFGSVWVYDVAGQPKKGFYVQMHTRNPDGQYVIENAYLDENGAEMEAPEGVALVSKPSPMPLFQILRPNTVNAEDLDSPMGASIFASSIDQLKSCDLVYDSYVNEFVLGKKRMYVPQSVAKTIMDEDGTLKSSFDPNDVLIYVYQQDENGKNELKPVDMTLRTAEHEAGIQRMINLLSKKCGLGTGRYRFDGGTAATATQVISENSDLYQSLKRHEKPLDRAIKGMVKALGYLMGKGENVDCTVTFDDSIIEDVNATISRNILLIEGGLKSKKQAIMEIFHVQEKDADKMLADIAQEAQIGIEAAQAAMSAPEGGMPDADEEVGR